MYYDDEARRFNFISGLVLGVVLGSGLALLASAPEDPPRKPAASLRKSAKRFRRKHSPRLERLRGDLIERAERFAARGTAGAERAAGQR